MKFCELLSKATPEVEEQKEVFHETVYQKLEGPKIMGKIELPVIKEIRKKEMRQILVQVLPIRKSVSVSVRAISTKEIKKHTGRAKF